MIITCFFEVPVFLILHTCSLWSVFVRTFHLFQSNPEKSCFSPNDDLGNSFRHLLQPFFAEKPRKPQRLREAGMSQHTQRTARRQIWVQLRGSPTKHHPNMHRHCHLCECILDFGPVYGFWCFSFERYNGILGALHVNNHQIEIQLMRKFIELQQHGSMTWPREFETFEDILVSADKGTLALTKKRQFTAGEYRQSIQLKVGTGQELHHLSFFDKHFIQVLFSVKEIYMSDGEGEALRTMYAFLHKEYSIVYVPKLSHKFSSLMLYDQKLDSQYSRSERSACILARWYGANGLDTTSVDLRPGEFVHVSCGEGSYNIT